MLNLLSLFHGRDDAEAHAGAFALAEVMSLIVQALTRRKSRKR